MSDPTTTQTRSDAAKWISTTAAAALADAAGIPATDRRSVITAGREGQFKLTGGGTIPFRVERVSFTRWLAAGGPRKPRTRRTNQPETTVRRPAKTTLQRGKRTNHVRGGTR